MKFFQALPFYNVSYGQGMPGVFNYVNEVSNNWFSTTFLIALLAIAFAVGLKSEYKASTVSATAFFIVLLTAISLRLVMTVNEVLIFTLGIGLAISIVIMYFAKK